MTLKFPTLEWVNVLLLLIPLNDIASTQIEPRSNTRISDLVIPDDTVKKYKG